MGFLCHVEFQHVPCIPQVQLIGNGTVYNYKGLEAQVVAAAAEPVPYNICIVNLFVDQNMTCWF